MNRVLRVTAIITTFLLILCVGGWEAYGQGPERAPCAGNRPTQRGEVRGLT